MFSPSRTSPKPVTGGAFAKLVTAGSSVKQAHGRGILKRWAIRLVAVVAALAVLWVLFLVTVRIATTQMWFDSVQQGPVYRTMVEAQILLFIIFAVIGSLVSGLTFLAIRRIKSPLFFSQDDDTIRWIFRKYEPKVSRLIVALVVVIPGILVGRSAANGWQTYLMWRHATPWHATDPLFHKDLSFFIEVYPFHAMLVSLLSQALSYALWIAVVGGYWYGAWRLRRGGRKVTREFTRLLSVLLGGYLLLKAANYWLARYALTTSTAHGPVTGPSYTDVHAGLPSLVTLTIVAFVLALVLLANGLLAESILPLGRFTPRGRVRVIALALVPMLIASAVIGSAWPGLVYKYREAPSAASLDLSEIVHNQTATNAAFDLDDDITTVPYNPPTSTSGATLVKLASSTAQASVIDPNQLSPTFNVEQQLRAYYGFKSTLDIGNYEIGGKSQDVALAVRELKTGSIPKSSWVNSHLVYTHGYGVVAAPTNQVDPKTESPVYLDGGNPPSQEIPVTQPDVYFGPSLGSSSYAIVGQPAGSTEQLEFDHPGANGSSKSAYTTYTGNGGIPIGSTLRRLLFAVQDSDPNILFSSEINSASQLLTLRDPRARVAKLAPWLTLDGDVYPAVVGGHIEWVVDGYTTSSNYPDSQLINLRSASRTTLTANGASISQASTQVNYMQNSVKAVVDAYTGKVTLYEWNQAQHPDPLLKTWEAVYPGLVQPQSSIPSALLSELRYPTDLFNVQRTLLAKYHVTQPASFYSGNDFWTVPTDPTIASSQSINSTSSSTTTSSVSTAALPSRYSSMSADGFGAQRYSLSSPMVTLNGQQLAAFVSVDAQPGPDYGKFTLLEYPSASGGESPAQVQNDIESNTAITEALTLQRGGNSSVVLGDLEAIPVAGRMLYVEPVYTQSSGSASFPVLRHVIALYANGDPSFENTLGAAIATAIESTTG
ncbi:UPF0182 family protein [Jatrophihabitans sp.]|uniref:UPF0182 family protein n=1 Tax=Jatrophihabitans sp. TaxID=1932789 RepID=UPI0030C74CC3|nr:hypothetical protein [Jatrophihabitans sp.]